jgi:hypothetical protein
MRRPKTLDIEDGWAECVSADEHPMRRSCVGLGMMPWLSAAQCRRLAAWLIQAADWIEAKEEGR